LRRAPAGILVASRSLRMAPRVRLLHRRFQPAFGERQQLPIAHSPGYAVSLATVEESTPLGELTDDLGQRKLWQGRSVRALNPLAAADVALLEAVSRGEFLIAGFRNRDIRVILYAAATPTPAQCKAQAR
jgi:hypothetical protein